MPGSGSRTQGLLAQQRGRLPEDRPQRHGAHHGGGPFREPEWTPAADSGNDDQAKQRDCRHQAAQRLREAVQAMAQQPAGAERNAAILQANQALFDTQQAMLQLPPDLRTGKTP